MSALSFVRRSLPCLLSIFGICGAGCADTVDPASVEELGSTHQDLGESTCATADPDATFEGRIDFTTSAANAPSIYNNAACYKSVVVDVKHYAMDFAVQQGGWTGVYWDDFNAQDKASCESQYLRAVLYEFHDGGPGVIGGYYKVEDIVASGAWHDTGNNVGCLAPAAYFVTMRANYRYRIAATARFGGVTRRLAIESETSNSKPPPSCDTCTMQPKVPVAEPSP